jgi:hypothetical protein
LEWDKFQVDLQYTLEVLKPALVRLAFSHIFQFVGMIAWGVGAIPLNVQSKPECDEDLALVIRLTRAEYAKAFRSTWMECGLKSASNKIVQRKEIGLLMQYHDSKMIHGR